MSNLLSTKEAAETLGESIRTVTRLANAGTLRVEMKAPGLRGAMFFRRSDVERLAAKRQKAVA